MKGDREKCEVYVWSDSGKKVGLKALNIVTEDCKVILTDEAI